MLSDFSKVVQLINWQSQQSQSVFMISCHLILGEKVARMFQKFTFRLRLALFPLVVWICLSGHFPPTSALSNMAPLRPCLLGHSLGLLTAGTPWQLCGTWPDGRPSPCLDFQHLGVTRPWLSSPQIDPRAHKLNLYTAQEARRIRKETEEVVHGRADSRIVIWASHLCSMLSVSNERKEKEISKECGGGIGAKGVAKLLFL